MTCSRVQKLLSAYVDKELTQSEYFVVRKHLTLCSECSDELESLSVLKSNFDELETVELPIDMWSNVKTAIINGELSTPSATKRSFWSNSFNYLKVIIPAAVIGIMVSIPLVSNITGISLANIFTGNKNNPPVTATVVTNDYNTNFNNNVFNNVISFNDQDTHSSLPAYYQNKINMTNSSQNDIYFAMEQDLNYILFQMFKEIGLTPTGELYINLQP